MQTALQLTPFCDAVSRGDLDMAAFLLADERVDPTLGCTIVAHPALFAAMVGNVELLQLFAAHRLLTDDVEDSLYKTAVANGQKVALHYVENVSNLYHAWLVRMLRYALVHRDLRADQANHVCTPLLLQYYIDSRPLDRLTPGRQLIKIRREFAKFDDDGNGFCDNAELRDLFHGLGVPLVEEELQEAFMVRARVRAFSIG